MLSHSQFLHSHYKLYGKIYRDKKYVYDKHDYVDENNSTSVPIVIIIMCHVYKYTYMVCYDYSSQFSVFFLLFFVFISSQRIELHWVYLFYFIWSPFHLSQFFSYHCFPFFSKKFVCLDEWLDDDDDDYDVPCLSCRLSAQKATCFLCTL